MTITSLKIFSSRYFIHIVLLAVVATRIPLLLSGYGSDPDAWRVARVATTLWQTGEYEMSRPPGYPLYEVVSAPFVALGGSRASNIATLVATLCLVVVTYRQAKQYSQHPHLLTLTVAFMPLVWLNSATTMDHVWSLLFLVLAWRDISNREFIRAGIWMGIAVGFRLSNVVTFLPFCIIIAMIHRSRKPVGTFLIAACSAGVLAFLPLVLTYGVPEWFTQTKAQSSLLQFSPADRVLFFGYRGLYAIGPLAASAAAFIIILQRGRIVDLIKKLDRTFLLTTLQIIVFALLFLWSPLDRSYLLPAVFFFAFLLDKISTQRQFKAFAACALSFAIINPDVIQHDYGAEPGVGFYFAPGLVIEEVQKREQQALMVTALASAAIDDRALIMTGTNEVFWFQNSLVERDTSSLWKSIDEPVMRQSTNSKILYAAALNQRDLSLVRSRGYSVFYAKSMKRYLESFVGYTMEDEGILPFPD